MAPMTYASTRCPACGSRDVLNVAMTVVELPLSFAFCSACEWKGWEQEGHSMSLSSVLGIVHR
jgi:formate dehydrogenase maturation protein FdhE